MLNLLFFHSEIDGIWNDLSEEVDELDIITVFKRYLDSYMISKGKPRQMG